MQEQSGMFWRYCLSHASRGGTTSSWRASSGTDWDATDAGWDSVDQEEQLQHPMWAQFKKKEKKGEKKCVKLSISSDSNICVAKSGLVKIDQLLSVTPSCILTEPHMMLQKGTKETL